MQPTEVINGILRLAADQNVQLLFGLAVAALLGKKVHSRRKKRRAAAKPPKGGGPV